MKQILHSLFIVLALSALFASCQKEVPTELTVTTTELTFAKEGGSQSISFSTNKNWTASASATWAKLSVTSGDSNVKTISVTADANADYDNRTCTITIKAEELSKTVNVKQSTNLGLILSPTTFDLTNAAQSIEVEVKANVQYSVSIDDACKEWISQASTKALTSSKVKFDVAANETYDNREGKITIQQTDGSLKETITIKQGQKDVLIADKKEYKIGKDGGDIEIKLKTNVGVSVEIPESAKDWIAEKSNSTKALTEEKITISVGNNETFYNREAGIVLKGNELQETITIKQVQTDALFFVDEKSFEVPSKGQSVSAQLFYNIDYEIDKSTLPDWITYSKTDIDKNNAKYDFVVSANKEYVGRNAAIVFVGKSSSLKDTISIAQHQVDIVYTDASEYNLSWKGGDFTIEVFSNVEYSMETPKWITEKSKESTTKGNLVLTKYTYCVDENLDIARTETIKYSWENEGVSAIYSSSINQECCTISLATAGTLLDELSTERINKVKYIKIRGEINGTDILMIRRMYSLIGADLRESTIVSGGSAYNGSFTTNNNVVGEEMFAYLNSIKEIYLPNSATTIDRRAFSHNYVIEKIIIGSKVTKICEFAFDNCSALKEITLPDTISSIEDCVFNNSGIVNIKIPSSVISIGYYAFGACHKLINIDIPESVKKVGRNCFMYCSGLKEIHFRPLPENVTLEESIFPNSYEKAKLFIPKGTKEAYYLTELGNFKTIIEE